MKRNTFIISLIILSSGVVLPLSAQLSQSDFDSMEKSFNQSFNNIETSSKESFSTLEAEYDAIQVKIDAEYDGFKREVSDVWGEPDATVSDRYRWVEYGDDKKSRSIVDFESGEVEIELLLTDEEIADTSLVEAKMEEAIQKLTTSKGKSVEYDSDYIPKEELSQSPIMDEIFDIRGSNINREAIAPINISSAKSSNSDLEQEVIALRNQAAGLSTGEQPAEIPIAKVEKTSNTEVKVEPKPAVTVVESVKTAEGDRNIVTVKTNLKVGYLGDLAKRYETLILSNAERFNISPTLIFAIMETESYFNPTATSHVPAYGLMQIVPKYAGRDTYKKLYGEDKIVSKDYLYQADKNIEMGTGFLNILSTVYFKNVTDLRSKELCMIAAYNTGPGNVSRAVVGHTNVFKSISTINSMSYDKLYSHLRNHLPYEETQNYIERVTTKRIKYIAK